ncbi:hypothetical protein ACFP2T_35935 [Plantactinospora solaniradicis]|uniref:Uncharacterized protein n=1 Tax=Plantactinospora solaniradicis TaxID=1723736 RepID=A0ABW1KKS2_9ACTN
MHVLFLALGATRRRAVIEESAQVVADGGRAVVLVAATRPWSRERFHPEVEVVDLTRLETRGPIRKVERALLFSGPGLVFRAAGRGPMKTFVRRAGGAYERRIASPVHRALMFRKGDDPAELRLRLIRRQVLAGRPPFDLFVVSDPASMPPAARLLAEPDGTDSPAPRVAYRYDYPGSGGRVPRQPAVPAPPSHASAAAKESR